MGLSEAVTSDVTKNLKDGQNVSCRNWRDGGSSATTT